MDLRFCQRSTPRVNIRTSTRETCVLDTWPDSPFVFLVGMDVGRRVRASALGRAITSRVGRKIIAFCVVTYCHSSYLFLLSLVVIC